MPNSFIDSVTGKVGSSLRATPPVTKAPNGTIQSNPPPPSNLMSRFQSPALTAAIRNAGDRIAATVAPTSSTAPNVGAAGTSGNAGNINGAGKGYSYSNGTTTMSPMGDFVARNRGILLAAGIIVGVYVAVKVL